MPEIEFIGKTFDSKVLFLPGHCWWQGLGGNWWVTGLWGREERGSLGSLSICLIGSGVGGGQETPAHLEVSLGFPLILQVADFTWLWYFRRAEGNGSSVQVGTSGQDNSQSQNPPVSVSSTRGRVTC